MDPDSFPFVLIGNKVDRESERRVSRQRALQWCKSKGSTVSGEWKKSNGMMHICIVCTPASPFSCGLFSLGRCAFVGMRRVDIFPTSMASGPSCCTKNAPPFPYPLSLSPPIHPLQ